MMIEIPDPPVILGMVVAFFVGLGGLYLFYKVRSYAETRNGTEPMSDEGRIHERHAYRHEDTTRFHGNAGN